MAEDVSAQMCLPGWCSVTDKREDGRFFDYAQNDMLCNCHWRNLSARSRHTKCHPEEVVKPVMCPRQCVYRVAVSRTIEKTGDSSLRSE